MSKNTMNERIRGYKLLLGLSIALLGILVLLIKPTEGGLNDSFKDEPLKPLTLSFQSTSEADEPNRIIIPKLSVNLPVKKALVIDGYWQVFEETAGWGRGSGIPGEPGNQVIFAHAREGLFLPLKEIKRGDLVYVLSEKEWFSYKVSDIKQVHPKDTAVIAPTKDETLTLYTCSGFSDSSRLIVTAKRVE